MTSDEKKRVMCFGTFDYLHAGHEHFLEEASDLGYELIVVIARDQTASALRGYTPDHKEKDRQSAVAKLPYVTKAILGEKEDKYKVIRKYRPNIIALGYDQHVFTQNLRKTLIELGLDTEIIRLEAYKPEMYKSSIIRDQTPS